MVRYTRFKPYTRRMVVGYALRQHAKWNQELPLRKWQRWAYTLKAIICMLMGRWRNLYGDLDAVGSIATWGSRAYSSPYGTEHEWQELAVGRGLRDWHYDIYTNGT